jgi:hypothetical protein
MSTHAALNAHYFNTMLEAPPLYLQPETTALIPNRCQQPFQYTFPPSQYFNPITPLKYPDDFEPELCQYLNEVLVDAVRDRQLTPPPQFKAKLRVRIANLRNGNKAHYHYHRYLCQLAKDKANKLPPTQPSPATVKLLNDAYNAAYARDTYEFRLQQAILQQDRRKRVIAFRAYNTPLSTINPPPDSTFAKTTQSLPEPPYLRQELQQYHRVLPLTTQDFSHMASDITEAISNRM